MSIWTDLYIGLPFLSNGRDRMGIDCWGLVRLVYFEQMNVELESFLHCDGGDYKTTSRLMAEQAEKWIKVDEPKTLDVILIRQRSLPCHVALWVSPGKMLHVFAGINSAIERINPDQVMGYYRYV